LFFLESAAFCIVALYVIFLVAGENGPGRFLSRLGLISVASWVAEETCIFLYDFYRYSPDWALFLNRVPLLVIIIWPAVIHSAWNLAAQLLKKNSRSVPFVAAAIVFSDAALMEPIAVNAHLWSWNEPGIFGVPPVGIFGWAFFTFLCVFLFEVQKDRQRGIGKNPLLVLVIPVIGTHLLLLGIWWGALRWANMPVEPAFAAGSAWFLSVFLVYAILRKGGGKGVRKRTLLLRVPGAVFFFLLLALNSSSVYLVVYSLAFVPPYLAIIFQKYPK
jgi:hypothetical protein